MKLIVTVTNNLALLDEVFSEIDAAKGMNRIQLKVMKAVFKTKVKGVYQMLHGRLKKYVVFYSDDCMMAEDEGDPEYILAQKKNIESFLSSGEKSLNGEKEYDQLKNDRAAYKAMKWMKNRVVNAKDKAISAVLGEGTVENFFSSLGIMFKIELVDPQLPDSNPINITTDPAKE